MASRRHPGLLRRRGGQAQLELIAAIPALAIAAALVLQLLAVGYAQSLADGAAEAGALAAVAGREVGAAARASIPDSVVASSTVERRGGRVSVRLRPPVLIPGIGRHLEVASSAWVRPPDRDGGEP